MNLFQVESLLSPQLGNISRGLLGDLFGNKVSLCVVVEMSLYHVEDFAWAEARRDARLIKLPELHSQSSVH